MNWKKVLIAAVAVLIIGFGYYALSPLFITIRVDEPLPSASAIDDMQATSADMPASKTPVNSADAPDAPSQSRVAGSNPVPVTGTVGHPASGTVRIVESGGKTYIRYENYKTVNGPDLYVYLATDKSAKDIVSLGPIKATEGNLNYEVPPGTDLSKYRHVLTWCRPFSVLFNSAELSTS